MPDIEQKKQQARELLIKGKVYKILAGAFAIVGIALFIFIYAGQYQGDITRALKDPVIILAILIPMSPAIILSFLASKTEKKFMKLYAELEASAPKKTEQPS